MKSLRAIVLLLVCLAVPYSATASVLLTLHCHHDGLDALIDTTGSAPAATHCHDHMTAGSDEHKGAPAKAGLHGCDCSVKCHCQHHCAANNATLAFDVLGKLSFDSLHTADSEYPHAFVPAVQHGTPLRPPIDQLSGVA